MKNRFGNQWSTSGRYDEFQEGAEKFQVEEINIENLF
jgi:hypothetical protein